jgi:FkbM family methyltransferase
MPPDPEVLCFPASDWSSRSLAYPRFGTCHYTTQPGARCEVSTRQQQLHLPVVHHAWSGIIAVTVDMAEPYTLDLFSPIPTFVELSFYWDHPGPHSVRIELQAGRNPQSQGNEVFLGEPSAQYWPDSTLGPALPPDLHIVPTGEGVFLLTDHDTTISRQLLQGQAWAPEELDVISRLVQPDWICVDAGAHIGLHTVALARRLTGGGRVIAFEPQPSLFHLLCANLALNHLTNVDAIQAALSRESGLAPFPIRPLDHDDNFGRYGILPPGDPLANGSIRTWSLDEFFQQHGLNRLDFLKVDVQAAELLVLEGARNTITTCRPAIQLEIAPAWLARLHDHDYRDVYSLLKSCGYRLCHLNGEPCESDPFPALGNPEAEFTLLALPA